MKINEVKWKELDWSGDWEKEERDNIQKEKERSIKKLEKYAELIKRDCQQFLKESQGRKLYRGIDWGKIHSDDAPFVAKKKMRKSRKSISTDTGMYNHLNYLMKKQGFITRAESTLFTGNPHVARGYGLVYLCFPLDGYKFLWSSKLDDYYTNSIPKKSKYNYSKDLYPKTFDYITKKEEVWRWWLHYRDSYKNTDLASAIKSKNEILMSGPGYYAIAYNKNVPYDYIISMKYLNNWIKSLYT